MSETLTVSTFVAAPPETLWASWTTPEHICRWNSASPDWHTPRATNDLRVGGTFCNRMEARDGSMGFDFEGVWTVVEPYTRLEADFGDRHLVVVFVAEEGGTRVTETFDPDDEMPHEMQVAGWQAILENFRKYTETL